MKDKHLHIPTDSALLKTIHRQVGELLPSLEKRYKGLITLKFLCYLLLMAAAYYELYNINNSLLFMICFAGYGLLALLFAFNFAHDFSHSTVFKSKRANNLGFIIIYTLNGAHAEAWKERHINSHHYAPNVEGYDTDLQITKLIRVLPGSKHHWYHRYQHLYAPLLYTTYSLFWVFIKDFVVLFSERARQKDAMHYLSFWLQKAFYLTYLLLLPIMYANQPWYVVIGGFLLMHLMQSLFLLFTFFMTHHVETTEYPAVNENGYIATSWLMNQVRSSNDMHPFSPAANFILGGFNNHVAHHLFPHVHHIYYPKVSRLLYETLRAHDIHPNHTSYWGGVVSHLKFLQKMSKREDQKV